LPLKIELPGTEFLDAETGGQKSAAETADVYRDRKSGNDAGEIPAETASLESPTKCAVWEDWMVVCAVICEPVSLLFGEYQGDFRKKQRSGGRKYRKRLQHGHFLNIVPIRYQGGTGSAQLPNTERALANRAAGK
jgi:hypothetical protein